MSTQQWEQVRKTATIFGLIEFLLCTAIDFERFDLRLWSKYHHVLLDVLQVPDDRFLFNSAWRIDCKDHMAGFWSDLCTLVRTIQNA